MLHLLILLLNFNTFFYFMVSTRSRRGRPLPAPRRPRARAPEYRPNDQCHRHRLASRHPKSVQVVSYRRRPQVRR